MKKTIVKQIEEVRRRIDVLVDSGDVSEDNIRRINIMTVKLANLKKRNAPNQVRAFS